jgi:hypothetical protein
VQNGFHSIAKILVDHDHHDIVIVSIGVGDIVR